MGAAPVPSLPGYALLGFLGEGTSGSVHRARHLSTGQDVAIKLLRRPADDDAAARGQRDARFLRETQLCARLHHPHIVRMLDRGETAAGEHFAVFEYVDGETLRDLLLRGGPLAPAEAAELMAQVLDALVAAHGQGVVHRDLKPLNIMVTRTGARAHAKVLDFGIGTIAGELAPAEARDAGLALGTPRYVAPEQLRGEPATARSDLYAWGLILVECLTGAPVVRGESLAQIYHQHLSPNEVPLPAALAGHPLGGLLRRVLAKNPRERVSEARELYEQLRQIPLSDLDPRQIRVGADSGLVGFASATDATRVAAGAPQHRRQITMLCLDLRISAGEGARPDGQLLDELLDDQLLQCHDACLAAGAFAAGALGGMRLYYFGYPLAADSAARSAARTALELLGQLGQRARRIERRDGVQLSLRIGLHTGVVLARLGQVPAGVAATVATRLAAGAMPGSIAASEGARGLLERDFLFEATAEAAVGDEAAVWQLVAERESLADSPEAGTRPLLGRAAELGTVLSVWDRARAGAACALLLSGEPGLGKSRLAQALRARIQADGGHSWQLTCLPEQRNTALYPFMRWLSAQLRLDVVAEPQSATRRLAEALGGIGGDDEAVAVLGAWLGLPPRPDQPPVLLAPQRQRQLVLDTLHNLLHALSGGPAVVVIEDVHWIDPTSRELLDRLVAEAPSGRLGLLLTTRPEGGYQPSVDRLQLGALAPSEAAALARALPGAEALDVGEIEQIVARAEGNPLYLTELTRARIGRRAGQGADADPIPASLRDVLGQALDRLGPAKETAQLAAVLGRDFDLGLLLSVALRDEASVQDDLELMELADLAGRQRRVQGDSFSFRHALICDAAYDSMTTQFREQTHARVARVLEAVDPEGNAVALARHYAGASMHEASVRHGTRAAFIALGRALYDEALGHAEVARGRLDRLPTEVRAPAELELGLITTQAMMYRYGWTDPRVRETVQHTQSLLTSAGSSEQRFTALWALAIYYHCASDRSLMRAPVAQLVAIAEASGDARLRRAAYTMDGSCAWIDGRYPDAAKAFRRVLAEPRAEAGADVAHYALDCRPWSEASLALVIWFIDGDREAALAHSDAALAEAVTCAHVPTLGIVLMYRVLLHQYMQDRAGMQAACGRLLELSRRYGLPAVEAYGAILDCWLREDVASMTGILGALDAMGCMLGLTYYRSLAGDLLAREGRLDEAIACLDECFERAHRIGERYYEPELAIQQAGNHLARGRSDARQQAARLLEHAIEVARVNGMVVSGRRAAAMLGRLG
ncbi:TOMM system kinase/cyclase fusion protein [Derxia gummosa]|uniref:TOMM system kinase/cyclase fusion protein n=1 Tax=Derxia gummosa DSM 723 TaxID=1121388 RepID=A0A8B6X8G0_9BURK|nr:TOMM system kinase/cyclase fusion protein [Derxia gummosa]